MSEVSPSGDPGAGRRTSLANERTLLAWWRTALTALAVALALGRLVPGLTRHDGQWPFSVIGVAFACYAIGLFIYGTVRSRARELEIGGTGNRERDVALSVLTVSGCVLAAATAFVILIG